MSDRTYTRFTVPMSILADAAKAEAVRSVFGFSTTDFHATLLAEPQAEEACGLESFAVRLVDERPCLVYEEEDCNYAGSHMEMGLVSAGIPFIQVNAAGDEYGPASTVFDGDTSEVIRLSHDLQPVVSIGIIDGRITVDPQEVADYERYCALRRAVVLWPAASAP
jgi:hypothetical protein